MLIDVHKAHDEDITKKLLHLFLRIRKGYRGGGRVKRFPVEQCGSSFSKNFRDIAMNGVVRNSSVYNQ